MEGSGLLRKINVQRCFRLIKGRSDLTRASLAQNLGFTRATAGYAVDELLQAGIVVETKHARSKSDAGPGRNGTTLSLHRDGAYFIGAEVKRNKVSLVVTDLLLRIRHQLEFSSHVLETGYDGAMQKLAEMAEKAVFESQLDPTRFRGIGWTEDRAVGDERYLSALKLWGDDRRLWGDDRSGFNFPRPFPDHWAIRSGSSLRALAHAAMSLENREDFLVLNLGESVSSLLVRRGVIDEGHEQSGGKLGAMYLMGSRGYMRFQDRVGLTKFKDFLREGDDPAITLSRLADAEPDNPDFEKCLDECLQDLAIGLFNAFQVIGCMPVVVTGPLSFLFRRLSQPSYHNGRRGIGMPYMAEYVWSEGAKNWPSEYTEFEVAPETELLGAAAMVRETLFDIPDFERTHDR